MTLQFRRICRDFGNTSAATGTSAKLLIIEVVERDAHDALATDCATSLLLTPDGRRRVGEDQLAFLGGASAASAAPDAGVDGYRERGLLGGTFGYRYVIGSALYYLFPGDQHRPGANGGVDVRRVDDGCTFFSNRDCNYGLFLGDDFTFQPLGAGDLVSTKLKAINGRFHRVLVIVVPNKSSVYLEPLSEARLKDASLRLFGERLNVDVVPLYEAFHHARSRIKDLYLPDNTHLSIAGYRELAAHVAAQVSVMPIPGLPPGK
jgi:hypothetical protein